MKIYIFIILAAATSISLISCDSKQSDTMIIGKVMETTIVK